MVATMTVGFDQERVNGRKRRTGIWVWPSRGIRSMPAP